MKTIYVTVQEFLANGGKLKKGRPVFTKRTDRLFGKIGVYDCLSDINKDMIVVKNFDKKFIMQDFILCVEIEVTPIYK